MRVLTSTHTHTPTFLSPSPPPGAAGLPKQPGHADRHHQHYVTLSKDSDDVRASGVTVLHDTVTEPLHVGGEAGSRSAARGALDNNTVATQQT